MSSQIGPHGGGAQAPPTQNSLPPGWTEHRAPTGHMYYHHAGTKTSTYTRPGVPPPPVQQHLPAPQPYIQAAPPQQHYPQAYPNQHQFPQYQQHRGGGFNHNGRHDNQRRHRYQDKPDKPKTKRAIPNAEPWLFVTTKKGNAFIHNPETKESLWTMPGDLKDAIESMEKLTVTEERERERIRRRQSALERQEREQLEAMADDYDDPADFGEPPTDGKEDTLETRGVKRAASTTAEDDGGEGDEYYDDDEYSDEEHDEKRMRLEGGPVEFTEDDLAWQLQAVTEGYGLGEEDLEDTEEMGLDDGKLVFQDLLEDLKVNPYSTWESEMPKLVDDGRYTALPTTKLRKQVFSDWCQDKIAIMKAEKEKEIKKDPRIAYLDFLENNASSKLFWPEFKRKFKKEAPMKDLKVSDKDREKYYREYITRTKTSVETRENDLRKHLKSLKDLSRRISLDNLPASISCDIRFVVVPRPNREAIITEHLRGLPEDKDEEGSAKDSLEKQRKALQDREAAVRREQFFNRKDVARGKEALRETEMQLKRAMNIQREGLLTHLEPAVTEPKEEESKA